MSTAATTGPIVINLYEHWLRAWAREWADLGELYRLGADREHIEQHDLHGFGYMLTSKAVPYCACFQCRVLRAWDARHEQVKPTPRARRRR